jgi:hypothetical protein
VLNFVLSLRRLRTPHTPPHKRRNKDLEEQRSYHVQSHIARAPGAGFYERLVELVKAGRNQRQGQS